MPTQTAILALESVLPPHVLTSADIESKLDSPMARLNLPKGVILGLTGIRERRLWDPGFAPSDAATQAARKALEAAGLDPSQIGVLINSSVCKDYVEPAVASLVHGNLGLPAQCLNFDVCNACLGFLNAINTVSMMIDSGRIDYGLIVDGESSREPIENTIRLLNAPTADAQTFHDNFATLTLGSGAAAMVLARADLAPGGHRINGSVSLADTRHSRLCLGQKDQMTANAPLVMKHGVELARQTWEQAGQTLPNWSDAAIDVYIPHQVSSRNIRVLNQTLGLTHAKHHLNFPLLGNIGPAAIPITLAQAQQEGRLAPGHHVALLGIGSGLNCTMMSVTW